jgi:lysine-N-methylase
MTRFRCLASDCEASCCEGGSVPIEEATHRRLTLLSEHDPALAELLARGIEPTPGGPAPLRLKFEASGACCMLDNAGLCRVQSRLGHDELFDVCATYPRYASRVDGEVELYGALSCPEVARLALLAEDALELETLDDGATPRKVRNDFSTDQPYFAHYRLVRAAFVGVLGDPTRELKDKLFALCWAAGRLQPVLYAGCAPVRGADLEALFDSLSQPAVLDELARQFRALTLDGSLAISVLLAALRPSPEARRAPGAQSRRYAAVWEAVERRYQPPLAAPDAGHLGAIQRTYEAQRGALSQAQQRQLDRRLARIAQNHVLTTPYMLHADVFRFTYDLVVRVAALSFLAHGYLEPKSASELDARLVEVVYAFTRRVENADVLQRLSRELEVQGLVTLPHALSFLALL